MSFDKREQLILGLLHGDSRTWAAARQRLALVKPKRRMRMRYLDEFAEKRAQSSFPVPYLHSTHESVLNPTGPADVSEWFAVSMLSNKGLDLDLKQSKKQQVWFDLTSKRESEPLSVRGRLGTTIAMDVIHATGSAKTAGKDNPHYFDDMALIRALAVAVSNEDESRLEAELREELGVTVSLDGVDSGVALGFLAKGLLSGEPVSSVIPRILKYLPEGGWSASVVIQALDLAKVSKSIDELGELLEKEIADHIYSYQIAAPETLAMACAYLAFATTREELLLGSFLNSSRSEVLTPLLWALAGVMFGGFSSSPGALQGVSVTNLKGFELSDIYRTAWVNAGVERLNNND